jgi:hypothetical protein
MACRNGPKADIRTRSNLQLLDFPDARLTAPNIEIYRLFQ